MKIVPALVAAALVAAGTLCVQADEPGPDVILKRTHVRKHLAVRTVVARRGERDGAVLFSGKAMSREYAYPRYSGYAYAPDYGFAYRLVPPVRPERHASSSQISSTTVKACCR